MTKPKMVPYNEYSSREKRSKLYFQLLRKKPHTWEIHGLSFLKAGNGAWGKALKILMRFVGAILPILSPLKCQMDVIAPFIPPVLNKDIFYGAEGTLQSTLK
ncbi:hypothetical protein EMIT0P294_10806 [Pseudomonas sp. IT-P294]